MAADESSKASPARRCSRPATRLTVLRDFDVFFRVSRLELRRSALEGGIVDYPPFADALARLRLFLNDQGHRGPIRWVFPSDVLLVAGQWLVRPRPEALVLQEVVAAYQRGITRHLGVKFGVLCREDEVLWCYIYCPADRIEAEHCLMPDGLK